MAPFVQVASLYRLSMNAFLAVVLESLNEILEFDDPDFCEVENYLENVPVLIKECILNSVLNDLEVDVKIRYQTLKLLLSHCTILATGIFPRSFYEDVLATIEDNGKRLRCLNMRGVWVKENHERRLVSMLGSLPRLRVLNIRNMATSKVLEVIAATVTCLKKLDISGKSDFSLSAIESLCSSVHVQEKLTVLNIGNSGDEMVQPAEVALFLKMLPHVTSLGDYSLVGQSLLEAVESLRTTKLKYVHDTNTDPVTMAVVVKLCPQLESIYLNQPAKGAVIQLSSFPHLRRVKLNKFHVDPFHEVVKSVGDRLEEIELLSGFGFVNIALIANTCTLVRKLSGFRLDVISDNSFSFPRLEYLSLRSSDMSTECLKSLLNNMPCITQLILRNEIRLSDIDMEEIICRCSFITLEDLCLSSAPDLTPYIVRALRDTCPRLRSLGELSGWNVTIEDFEEIAVEIISCNFDLNLF